MAGMVVIFVEMGRVQWTCLLDADARIFVVDADICEDDRIACWEQHPRLRDEIPRYVMDRIAEASGQLPD